MNSRLGPKRLELLHELLPAATVIALLVNPTNLNAEPQLKGYAGGGARASACKSIVLNAGAERDFDAAFASLVQQRAAAF